MRLGEARSILGPSPGPAGGAEAGCGCKEGAVVEDAWGLGGRSGLREGGLGGRRHDC